MTELEERLDPQTLADLIYRHFYNGPVGGARQRLARIIRNHVLGLPIMYFQEVLDEYLTSALALNDSNDPVIRAENQKALADARALFWKGLNGVADPVHVDGLITYAATKELTACIADTIARRKS